MSGQPTTLEEAFANQIAHQQAADRREVKYDRSHSLRDGFVRRYVPEYGTGIYPVNIETGEVCEWQGQWDPTGTVLLCVNCFEDGT